MTIIFADIDNNLQYIKPENVVFVKHNGITSEVGLATTNIKGEPINHVTKTTDVVAASVLSQLESQNYQFINLSEILDNYTFGTYYVNKKSIKSVLTYHDIQSKYNPKTYVEIKNENQNSCIIFNQVDQEKLRLFINSLGVKK